MDADLCHGLRRQAPASLSRQSRGQRTRRDRWRSTRPIEKVSPSDGTGPPHLHPRRLVASAPARSIGSSRASPRFPNEGALHFFQKTGLVLFTVRLWPPARTLRRHTLEICDLPLAACLNHRNYAAVCAGRLRYEREFLERSRSHMKSSNITAYPISPVLWSAFTPWSCRRERTGWLCRSRSCHACSHTWILS